MCKALKDGGSRCVGAMSAMISDDFRAAYQGLSTARVNAAEGTETSVLALKDAGSAALHALQDAPVDDTVKQAGRLAVKAAVADGLLAAKRAQLAAAGQTDPGMGQQLGDLREARRTSREALAATLAHSRHRSPADASSDVMHEDANVAESVPDASAVSAGPGEDEVRAAAGVAGDTVDKLSELAYQVDGAGYDIPELTADVHAKMETLQGALAAGEVPSEDDVDDAVNAYMELADRLEEYAGERGILLAEAATIREEADRVAGLRNTLFP